MGRQLYRVPLDFAWPLTKPWEGYTNPHNQHRRECPHCAGSGLSGPANKMAARWYGRAPFQPEDRGSVAFTPQDTCIRELAQRNTNQTFGYHGTRELAVERKAQRLCEIANRQWCHHLNEDDVAALLAKDRLIDLTHEFRPGKGWRKREGIPAPTARQVNEWSLQDFGHDAVNQSVVIRAECARLGIAHSCATCNGEGIVWSSQEARELAEDWTAEGPPRGSGYQLWETVSNGSPISPVFASAPELASWLVAHSEGLDAEISYAQWLAFLQGPGWAPTLAETDTGLCSGVLGIV